MSYKGNETAMIDHTILDVIVIDDNTRKTFRPRMVFFTDAYTRCITHIRFERPHARVRLINKKE